MLEVSPSISVMGVTFLLSDIPDIIVIKNKLDDPENKDLITACITILQSTKPAKVKNQRTRAPEAKLVIYV